MQGVDLDNVAYVFQVACLSDANKLKTFCMELIVQHYAIVENTEAFQSLHPAQLGELKLAKKGHV
jgi:hypothetical protein